MRAERMCLSLAAIMLAAASAAAQTPLPGELPASYEINRLNDYAAQISWRFVYNEGNRTWVCRGIGSAIFLGENRFLTAAHVVDQNPFTDHCADYGVADPVVEFGSAQLHGRVLKAASWDDEDGLVYPGGMDLAVVEVDSRMIPVALRSPAPLAVCASDLPLAKQVRVATEYGVAVAMTKVRTSQEFARIDLIAKNGDSGGGVFDPLRQCLLGIISNGGPHGTNYVPNDVIRRFLAAEMAKPPS